MSIIARFTFIILALATSGSSSVTETAEMFVNGVPVATIEFTATGLIFTDDPATSYANDLSGTYDVCDYGIYHRVGDPNRQLGFVKIAPGSYEWKEGWIGGEGGGPTVIGTSSHQNSGISSVVAQLGGVIGMH